MTDRDTRPQATRQDCLDAGGGPLARFALRRLRWRGDIAERGGTVRLTDAGRAHARTLVRSHRLWEAFLEEHFALPPDHLHEPASRIEHFIGPELQQELESDLARPQTDPHGRRIPPAG